MGSQLSPILQAYFGGQKQQADLISQAKDISDAALRRQQAATELQQRQQTIDEVANYHKAEGARQQGQLELSQKIAADTHQYQYNEAADRMIKSLQNSGVSPDQFMEHHLANLNVPGYAAPAATVDDGSMSALPQNAPPGVILPNVSVPTGNMATVPIPGYPGQPATVPAWKTSAQMDAEKRQADLGAQTQLYNDTMGKTSLANNQNSNAQRLQAVQDKIDSNELIHNLTNNYMYDKLDLQRQLAELKATGGRDPSEVAQTGSINGELIGAGQKSLKDLADPVDKKAAATYMASRGLVEPPKGTMQEFGSSAESLERLANSLPVIRNMLQSNTQTGGSAANTARSIVQGIAGKVGVTASPTAATFNTYIKSLAPDLEKAQGLSLARAGSSPAMAMRMDQMQPNLNDLPDTANTKVGLTADVYLQHMADQISTLPLDQRKSAWATVINDHPGIIQNLPGSVAAKVYRAKQTGLYNPGGVVK